MSAHVSSPMASGSVPSVVMDDSRLSEAETPDPAPVLSSDPSDAQGTSSQPPPTTRRSTPTRLPRNNTLQNAKDKDPKGHAKSPSTTVQSNVGLDPLSTQIYLRTSNTTEQPSITQRIRNTGRPDSPTPDAGNRQSSDTLFKSNGALDATKERRKGPSILSRLSMRTTWRKDDDMQDSDSDLGELRTDGSSARALTSVIGAGGGYIPMYKEPTRYIRVRPHNKKTREFNRLFLAQELMGAKPPTDEEPHQGRAPAIAVGKRLLRGGGDAIWAAEFSLDGRYLAVAGKDQTVRVFAVISTPEERLAHEEDEAQNGGDGSEKLSAPVFRSKPTQELKGHTGEILSLSWSKNNFLLSSSMDKTVKLWHMSREDCLCTFKHSDIVTSIAFHPTDDRFFLAGSMDGQLRLWSIPDKSVAFSAPTNEFTTAVAFSPDGKTAICGLLSGLCMFFQTEGMTPQFQIHVRSSRGKNARGSKITGIRTIRSSPDSEDGEVKVLISSNDSRVRVYNLKTRMLEIKFKGLENQSSQIHARFSDDAKYIISGSEDRKAYIWALGGPEAEMKDKQPYECFDAHPEVVTTALMAPTKTRQLLSGSLDPIYDLCNPPPVMLVSLDERPSRPGSSTAGGETPQTDTPPKKPEESPAYLERSKHYDGNIIVTTDRTGTIKVFRQDCAFTKRQQNLWETGSKFSGKFNSVGRSASVATRTSGGSRIHSRRESLNYGNFGPHPALSQPASDRIMSWRQDIEGGRSSIALTPTRTERSLSPMKANRYPINTSAANLASGARRQTYTSSPSLRPENPVSPSSSIRRTSVRIADPDPNPSQPPTPSFSLISASDPEQPEDKGQGGFWNLSRWRGISGLRYSVSAIPVLGAAAQTSTSPTRESGSLSPGEKSAARRSVNIAETGRLTVVEDADRRKSLATETPSPALVDERVFAQEKERNDSGVGRLSAESIDEAVDTCKKCGNHSFTRTNTGLVCAKCDQQY